MDIDRLDRRITTIMARHGVRVLRIALAIVFFWFGLLKVLGTSPAAHLIERTVVWFDPDVFIPVLGWWEMLIGALLLFRPLIRAALLLLFLQMPGTVLPLILLPEVCFTEFPGLTLEGQYIIKNVVLVGAAIVVGGTARMRSTKRRLL